MIKNRIKVLLAERDMNLNDLARVLGVHYTTIHRFASGTSSTINKQLLSDICAALDVQPGDVFTYQPDAPDDDPAE